MSEAMKATGLSTKRATVEEGLRLLVRVRKQAKAFTDLKGLGSDGDLDAMRQVRHSDRPWFLSTIAHLPPHALLAYVASV